MKERPDIQIPYIKNVFEYNLSAKEHSKTVAENLPLVLPKAAILTSVYSGFPVKLPINNKEDYEKYTNFCDENDLECGQFSMIEYDFDKDVFIRKNQSMSKQKDLKDLNTMDIDITFGPRKRIPTIITSFNPKFGPGKKMDSIVYRKFLDTIEHFNNSKNYDVDKTELYFTRCAPLKHATRIELSDKTLFYQHYKHFPEEITKRVYSPDLNRMPDVTKEDLKRIEEFLETLENKKD